MRAFNNSTYRQFVLYSGRIESQTIAAIEICRVDLSEFSGILKCAYGKKEIDQIG